MHYPHRLICIIDDHTGGFLDRTSLPIPGQRPHEPPAPDAAVRLRELRPYVRQSGDDWRAPWLLTSRRLLDYLLVYIPEGTGRFSVDKTGFDVEPNTVVWVPPDTLHQMQGFAPKMHCVFVHFDLVYDPGRSHWDAFIPGGTVDLSQWQHLMHPPVQDPLLRSLCGMLALPNHAEVFSQLKDIVDLHRRASGTAAVELSGMMLALVDTIVGGVEAARSPRPAHWQAVQNAAVTIRETREEEIDVTALAARAGLSASHFRREFRAAHGTSPARMHHHVRIARAQEMLAYTSQNVSQIAYALGYSTVHNFSRAFRDAMGVSPRQYRQGSVRRG